MKNKIILAASGILIALSAFSQQDISFTQYFFNPMFVNPAYAGSRGTFSGTAVYRDQWVGMQGAPMTGLIDIHDMVPHSNVGLGLQFYSDNAGPLTNTNLSAVFAYHIPLTQKLKLSLGIQGCMDNLSFDYNELNVATAEDPSFMGSSSMWVPDANAGAYLYSDHFFFGASVKHLLQPNFGILNDYNTAAEFYRSYYLMAGVVIPLGTDVALRPSVLGKYVQGAPTDFDVDLSLILFDRFYIGGGIRTDKRIDISGMDNIFVATIEYDVFNRLRIGYAFDCYLSQDAPSPYITHEIMIGWDIYHTTTRMTSPKYF
jgi:type IX secretion system PorP/SprF family membrane protein